MSFVNKRGAASRRRSQARNAQPKKDSFGVNESGYDSINPSQASQINLPSNTTLDTTNRSDTSAALSVVNQGRSVFRNRRDSGNRLPDNTSKSAKDNQAGGLGSIDSASGGAGGNTTPPPGNRAGGLGSIQSFYYSGAVNTPRSAKSSLPIGVSLIELEDVMAYREEDYRPPVLDAKFFYDARDDGTIEGSEDMIEKVIEFYNAVCPYVIYKCYNDKFGPDPYTTDGINASLRKLVRVVQSEAGVSLNVASRASFPVAFRLTDNPHVYYELYGYRAVSDRILSELEFRLLDPRMAELELYNKAVSPDFFFRDSVLAGDTRLVVEWAHAVAQRIIFTTQQDRPSTYVSQAKNAMQGLTMEVTWTNALETTLQHFL